MVLDDTRVRDIDAGGLVNANEALDGGRKRNVGDTVLLAGRLVGLLLPSEFEPRRHHGKLFALRLSDKGGADEEVSQGTNDKGAPGDHAQAWSLRGIGGAKVRKPASYEKGRLEHKSQSYG